MGQDALSLLQMQNRNASEPELSDTEDEQPLKHIHVFNSDLEGSKENLELFMNEMTLFVLHGLVSNNPNRRNDGEKADLKQSMKWVELLNPQLLLAVACLTKKKTQCGHRRKLYMDTYDRLLLLSVDYWEIDDAKDGGGEKVTMVVEIP